MYFLLSTPRGKSTRPVLNQEMEIGIIGQERDVKPVIRISSTTILLMGGGSDVNTAFSEFAFPKIKTANLLVLRESGGMAYNNYFATISDGRYLASVETIVVDSRDKANSDYVCWAIDHAEMIWFAGGNQARVLKAWRGTKLQNHLQNAVDRGVLIGGTSSGLTILSSSIYAPPDEYRGSTGEEALLDPYNIRMQLQESFLKLPQVEKLLLDGHTIQRAREGRAIAQLARKVIENNDRTWRMLALDEATAIYANDRGEGIVISEDNNRKVLYLMFDEKTKVDVLKPGAPLVIHDLAVVELMNGDPVDLNHFPSSDVFRYSSYGDGQLVITSNEK